MSRTDRSRLRAQGIKLRELEDRYAELREAVERALIAYDEGTEAEDVFDELRRELEHVPAGKWSPETLIAKAQEWNERYGEPPAAIDWNPSAMRQRKREHLLDRWTDGDWPSLRTVIRLFGTWNAFISQAGFPPRLQADPNKRGPGGAGKGLDHLPEWQGWQTISALRDQRGLSQARIADRAGISYEYWRAIERGEQTNPGVRVLIAVARALTVAPSALLDTTRNDVGRT